MHCREFISTHPLVKTHHIYYIFQLAAGADLKQGSIPDDSSNEDGGHVIKRRSAPESSGEKSDDDNHNISLHGKMVLLSSAW